MEQNPDFQRHPQTHPEGNKISILKLEFNGDKNFETDLHDRVNDYFKQSPGHSKSGNWQMYLKSLVLFACFTTSYLLLVFVAETVWQGLFSVIFLGLSTAGIGFNIAHDGGHKAYSKNNLVNKIMAMTMDFVGGSSYMWFWKHSVIHHRFVNITGFDTDIDLGFFGRLSPHQKRLPFHRWQHLYLWFVYGFLAVKWEFIDDFRNIISGKMGNHRFPRPPVWEFIIFVSGRIIFFTWALIVPLMFHPWYSVIFFYFIGAMVLGITLSLVFQLPHCVTEADFPVPNEKNGIMEAPWAVHQASATVDFARHNPILTWFLGGLNFHKEHHLFPTICHMHYPAITKIIEETCKNHGIKYFEHKTFLSGIKAHYQWLKKMGQPDE